MKDFPAGRVMVHTVDYSPSCYIFLIVQVILDIFISLSSENYSLLFHSVNVWDNLMVSDFAVK